VIYVALSQTYFRVTLLFRVVPENKKSFKVLFEICHCPSLFIAGQILIR
jgi:hypothetical protein